MVKKKDWRKQQILQAATEVFGYNDFQNVGISDIARKANIAEGTIYHYFRNKEDLYFSIPARKMEIFCEELDLHLEGIEDAVGKLRKLIWFSLYFLKKNPEHARILMLEMRVSRNFPRSRTFSRVKAFSDKILELIHEGQEEGLIRKEMDGHVLQELLLGFLEHRVTRWLLKEETFDLMENCEVCDVLFN